MALLMPTDDRAARAALQAAREIDFARSNKDKLTVSEMAYVIREEIAPLVEENARLRHALEKIRESPLGSQSSNREIARAVLARAALVKTNKGGSTDESDV